jgi:hypothetical protein
MKSCKVKPVKKRKPCAQKNPPDYLDAINDGISKNIDESSHRDIILLLDNIQKYTQGGGILDDSMRQCICNYIEKIHLIWYDPEKDGGHKQSQTSIMNKIGNLISCGFHPTPRCSMYLMRQHKNLVDIVLKHYNHTFDYSFITSLFAGDMPRKLIKYLIEDKKININFTDHEKIQYIMCIESDPMIIRGYIDSLPRVDQQTLNFVTRYHKFKIFERIVTQNGIINDELLENACASNIDRYSKIEYIFDNKIEPTKKAFDIMVDNSNTKINDKINDQIYMMDVKNYNRMTHHGMVCFYLEKIDDQGYDSEYGSDNNSDNDQGYDSEYGSDNNSDNDQGYDQDNNPDNDEYWSDNDQENDSDTDSGYDSEASFYDNWCHNRDDIRITPNNMATKFNIADGYIIIEYDNGRIYKARPKRFQQNVSFTIELFIKYGYNITYDDVIYALKKHIIVLNIERFKIKFDITYLHICAEKNIMLPYDENVTGDIKPDIIALNYWCENSQCAQIKSALNAGVQPDITTMRSVCKGRNKIHIIRLIASYNTGVDLECLENAVASVKHASVKQCDKSDIEFLETIKSQYKETGIIDKKTLMRSFKKSAKINFVWTEFKKSYLD